MSGVLLDPKTGKPEPPENLRAGFGKPEGAGPGVLFDWVNPSLARAPAHVLDSLRRAHELGNEGPRGGNQGWEEVIYNAGVNDGTQVLNTVTETIMVPDYNYPNAGNQALYVGKILKYKIWGRVSTVVTTPGTIIFRLRWGGVAGTVLILSKAQRPKVTVSTNMAAYVEFEMECRAIGTAGSLFGMGDCVLGNSIGDAAAVGESVWPDAPAAVAVNTMSITALSATIQFSVATATTAWTTHLARLEALN